MDEITNLSRYEIRGAIVWDKVAKRPVQLDEILEALELAARIRAVAAHFRNRGCDL